MKSSNNSLFYLTKFKYFIAFSFPCSSGESIGQCVSGIYTWSLTVVGILAFFQIIYAGVIYLTAVGNASRISQAKSKIWKAILGIILLFSSYLILYTINPDLVGGEFKLPILQDKTEKPDYNSVYLQETVQSSAVKGQEYNSTIRPTGGTPPYDFKIVEGQLPPGLKLEPSADGTEATISGTPIDQTPFLSPLDKLVRFLKTAVAEAAARDYTFKVKITDSQGKTIFETMTISVEIEDVVADAGDGGPTPTSTTTASPLPESGDFGRATQTEFIQAVEISDKETYDPIIPAGSDLSLRAKKLYKVKFKIDTSTVFPFLVRSGSQWVAVPPKTRITSSVPIEYVDHTKIVHNKRQVGTIFNVYPTELLKIESYLIYKHNSNVGSLDPKNKIFSLQPILSKGIARGTTFLIEGQNWITVSGSERGGAPSSLTLKNIYELFESVPVQGYIYVPESELGKKINLTLELLGKDKEGKLIKDKRTINLSIDSENRPPVVFGQICAASIRGRKECNFPSLRDVSWFSQWQLYLASLDGRKTYDPDGDRLNCLWLNKGFAIKGFYPSPISPSGCFSPGLERPNPYSSANAAGNVWINWWPGLGRSTDKFETNYRTNEFGEADSFVITDGSLLSDVVIYEISTGKEADKIYPLASCDPTKDGAEKVKYSSGAEEEYWCTRITEPSAGSWLWRGQLNLDGDIRDFNGCSGTVGPNAILEYSSIAGGGKWKCERAGQYWRLKPI